jgi:phosphatidylglycerophosphate synthase
MTAPVKAGSGPQGSAIPPAQPFGKSTLEPLSGLLKWWWRRVGWLVRSHPRLIASWAATAASLTLLDTVALALVARLGGRDAARRAAPGLALSLAVMHVDTLLRLGTNASEPGAEPHDTIGLPVALTLLRRNIAGFLWAHLIGGRPLASRPTLAALLAVGAASDVVDGALARRRRRTTRLGAYLDAEADFSFWAAMALTLGACGRLPRWLIALLFARFGAPVVFAGVSHFGLGRPVPVGSTIAGKAAAVAQLVVCGAALRPRGAGHASDRASKLLHVVVAGFLLAAPLAQAWRLLGAPHSAAQA